MFLGLVRRFSVSVKGVVCVWVCVCVFGLLCVVCLPCPCLRLMSRPLRGWHWTVVPFWIIALERVSDNTISSVLSLAPSLFLSCTCRALIHWKVAFLHIFPWCSTKICHVLNGMYCLGFFLSHKIDSAHFIVCGGFLGWPTSKGMLAVVVSWHRLLLNSVDLLKLNFIHFHSGSFFIYYFLPFNVD